MNIFNPNINKGFPNLGPLPDKSPVGVHNPSQIQNLLANKGILCFHIKHALDHRRPNKTIQSNDGNNNENFLYYDIKPLLCVPQGLDAQTTLMQQSIDQSFSSGFLNVTGTYLDDQDKRVFIRPNDLIAVNPTVTYMNQELIKHDTKGKFYDLKFYAQEVDYIAYGDRQLEENEYFLQDGKLQLNVDVNSKNETVSVVYYHSILFTVGSIPHSVHLIMSNAHGVGGARKQSAYSPQMISVSLSKVQRLEPDATDIWRHEIIQQYEEYLKIQYQPKEML